MSIFLGIILITSPLWLILLALALDDSFMALIGNN